MRETPIRAGSDLHQLLFFLGEQLVDFGDVSLSVSFWTSSSAATLVVFGDRLVLHCVLQLLVGIAAQVADGDLGVPRLRDEPPW
jgi:hypothetical protein